MRRLSAFALLVLVAILAAGCAASRSSPSASAGTIGAPAAAPVPAGDAAKRGEAVGGTTPQSGIPSLVSTGRDLVLTANLAFRSQDPWATADKVRAIAAGLGGDLLGLSQTGAGDQRSALVTIRVPSSRFDDALAQLKQLDGEVVTSNVDAKDVTDQFVDVQARLGAKKAEEQQYLTLLARANTVDEILKVQGALASTRVQIEQLQAQVSSLKTRIDYSTITMSISPLVTVPGMQVGTWDPSRTLAQAIAALSALFRVAGDAAIWVLVFLWIPLLALVATLVATRVRRGAPA
ncbi:MAG TPA: DUF4349 domain-containing protein [Candidatus Limnocylindria bacterium]|nr:DUF4349 domain-containing protein [Candidatus Limnocylindria bacterium]